MLAICGRRWRGFKTQLMREYVSKAKEDCDPPYARYIYITEDIWKKVFGVPRYPCI
jgi:hypothetical protein